MEETTLVLSGGGVKGFLTLGALSVFDRTGKLRSITRIIGTSVGSLIGLLLIGGVSPLEIFETLYTITNLLPPITEATPVGETSPLDSLRRAWATVGSALGDWGLLDSRLITNRVEEMLTRARTRSDNLFFGMTESPTFAEVFERTNKRLVIIATNLSKKVSECFSVETTPHLRCMDAARMSSSIPIIFKSLRYHGDFFVDGAVLNNFPIEYVPPGEKYLGILIASEVGDEIESFLDYVNRIVSLPMWMENERKARHTGGRLVVVSFPISGVDFSPSVEDRIRMFARGIEAAEALEERREGSSPSGAGGVPPEIEGIVDHPPSPQCSDAPDA